VFGLGERPVLAARWRLGGGEYVFELQPFSHKV